MSALCIFLFALLGVAVGSFLNVCIDRLPRRESLLFPASHCEVCHHPLGVKDLVPLLSYLFLRGRCRYCHCPLSPRLPLVEFVTATIFALFYWRYGLSPELGVMLFYSCLFLIVFFIDLEHGLILNLLVYPAMVVALLLALFVPQRWLVQWLVAGVGNAALGGAVGFTIFFLIALASRGGMGWGDVKLAGLIGLATGFPLVLVSIFLAALCGGAVAVALLGARKKTRHQTIPFGPFLASAALVTLLWGRDILTWYLALLR